MRSDNSPQFNGHEFKNFSEYLGFNPRGITPYWPKAKREAERLVQTLEKEGKNWKQGLYEFLRHYRATPQSLYYQYVFPFEALNNRNLKTSLPELPVTI